MPVLLDWKTEKKALQARFKKLVEGRKSAEFSNIRVEEDTTPIGAAPMAQPPGG